jgi:CRP-like cAMP-binding protein
MRKKQILSQKRKVLAAQWLAQRIGYLRIEDIPNLPIQTFNAHRIIRPKDQMFIVRQGVVEIWHTAHDMLVTELGENTLFGDMPLLGQTMLGTQAIAGSGGVYLSVLDIKHITNWIRGNPISLLQEIGPRFAVDETTLYRIQFQDVQSRLAALLLELAEESTVRGFTQSDLAQQLGSYRETVTNTLSKMKTNKLIEIRRKTITLLNTKALKELSEL